MIIVSILTASLIHFSLKGWENLLFKLGSEWVKKVTIPRHPRKEKAALRIVTIASEKITTEIPYEKAWIEMACVVV